MLASFIKLLCDYCINIYISVFLFFIFSCLHLHALDYAVVTIHKSNSAHLGDGCYDFLFL